MEFNSDLLKRLVDTYSPSGNEEKVTMLIKDEIKDYVDDIKVDNLGNLIARIKGNGKKIMIAAHMDQIGLMVTDIDKNGFLRFTNVGGISSHLTLGQRVIFDNKTIGVVFAEEIEDKGKLKLENMYIDIGAVTKEEAEEKINIGDICVYNSEYFEDHNRVISRCLDDRIGCYIMIETIKKMKLNTNDLYFVFTVQEELGIRGAKTSAFSIDPDLGIAIDITGSGDTPKAKKFAIRLNKGVAIKVKDNYLMAHPKVKRLMVETAKDNGIDYQMEVLEYGGTDAGAIHLSREGVPSGAISIPTRYAHTSHETISKKDVIDSISLLIEILKKNIDF